MKKLRYCFEVKGLSTNDLRMLSCKRFAILCIWPPQTGSALQLHDGPKVSDSVLKLKELVKYCFENRYLVCFSYRFALLYKKPLAAGIVQIHSKIKCLLSRHLKMRGTCQCLDLRTPLCCIIGCNIETDTFNGIHGG